MNLLEFYKLQSAIPVLKYLLTSICMLFIMQVCFGCEQLEPEVGSCGTEVSLSQLSAAQDQKPSTKLTQSEKEEIIAKAYAKYLGRWQGYLTDPASNEKVEINWTLERDESGNPFVKIPSTTEDDSEIKPRCISNIEDLPFLITIESDKSELNAQKLKALFMTEGITFASGLANPLWDEKYFYYRAKEQLGDNKFTSSLVNEEQSIEDYSQNTLIQVDEKRYSLELKRPSETE